MLERWARVVVRRRWWVLGSALLTLVVLGAASIRFGGDFSDNFRIPGSESQRAFDLLEAGFTAEAGSDARIVWAVDSGDVYAPAVRERLQAALEAIGGLDGVLFVRDPYEVPALVAADGAAAYATVRFAGQPRDVPEASVERLLELVADARAPGLRVEAGGEVVSQFESEGPGRSEIIGVAAAAVVLLIAFGSIIAMGLPLITALLGLAAGFFLIRFAALAIDISTFAPSFAAMLGIGVGIDYALFVVTRFREGLAAGWSVEQSVVTAVTTAGRAVAFAGIVVLVALLGLYAIGIPFVANLGLSAAIVVGIAVIVALTILPALLATVGRNIDRWSLPFLRTTVAGDPEGFWYRFSRHIQGRAALYLVLGAGALVLLAVPLLDAELGTSDEGNNPQSFASRRAYDLLGETFGPGFNGPFIVVVDDTAPLRGDDLTRLAKAVASDPNVESVSPPALNESGRTAVLTVIPGTAPQDAATRALVDRLRAEAAPRAAQAMEGDPAIYIAGSTAAFVDIAERIGGRLPAFFAVVIGFAILLLLAAFRSVAVPIKAAIMNLLAIAAAIGFVIAVFQWGWGASLIGVDRVGPIESFLPMFMFAILFGLSMDYEVFLLSRIRERYLETGGVSESIAHGISASARVITAAAAILVTVFASFLLGDERVIKEFGLGLAFAIFIDATVVRLILVPATMQLLGRANWWMPGWLDRRLPRVSIDPPAHAQPVGPSEAPARQAPALMATAPSSAAIPTALSAAAGRSAGDVRPEPEVQPAHSPAAAPAVLVDRPAPPRPAETPAPAAAEAPPRRGRLRWAALAGAVMLGFAATYRFQALIRSATTRD